MKRWLLVSLLGLMTACGADDSDDSAQAQAQADKLDKQAIEKAFGDAFKGLKVTAVEPSPMEGIVAVEINGRETVYSSADGRFVFLGKMLELKDGEAIDPAEQKQEAFRAAAIPDLDEKTMISYTAEEEQAEIYVFTDITCGFCRKLHRHIKDYTQAGVTVHYLAFPRGGTKASSAEAMRHIWCAKDPQQSLTDAKLENKVAENELGECAKLVDEQYQLGLKFGVAGTPAIYTREGRQLGGYVTPEQLQQRLAEK